MMGLNQLAEGWQPFHKTRTRSKPKVNDQLKYLHPGQHTSHKPSTDVVIESVIENRLAPRGVVRTSPGGPLPPGTVMYDWEDVVVIKFKKRELKNFVDQISREFRETQDRISTTATEENEARINTAETKDSELIDDQIFREALGRKRKEVNTDFEIVHLGRMKLSPLSDEEDILQDGA